MSFLGQRIQIDVAGCSSRLTPERDHILDVLQSLTLMDFIKALGSIKGWVVRSDPGSAEEATPHMNETLRW